LALTLLCTPKQRYIPNKGEPVAETFGKKQTKLADKHKEIINIKRITEQGLAKAFCKECNRLVEFLSSLSKDDS
jgi:hypothetical protein